MSFSPFVGASSGGGGGGTSGKSIQSITFYSSSGGATPGIAGAKDTYKINYTDGTSSTFVVQNGSVGTSITKVTINTSGHLIVTMSDGSTVDAGATGSQVTFTPVLTRGTKIGSISVDGKSTDLYCEKYSGEETDYGTITVEDGKISLTNVTKASTATKATQDADGNTITDTYALKTEIPTVDSEISDSSTNPVQNKTIKTYIDDIVGDINSILATLTDIGG